MKNMLNRKILFGLVAGMTINMSLQAATIESVLEHYSDLAHVMYGDALQMAKTLQNKIDVFIATPNEKTLAASKQAWIEARVPYMQTEAYRFGNAIVDEWEGNVNAWPLDEGLIDYTASSYGEESEENPYYTANVVANKKLLVGGQAIDASKITKQLIAESLHEIDGVETNVARGYHAIEFLLWGQDLNGTHAGAGKRPASDFDSNNCTVGNCERRADYLKAVADLLVDDLEWMVNQWAENGAARKAVIEGDPQQSLAVIFTGMGSLSYGELAGERMKLGLLLHDPEEEHDCFSDNTHWSHYYDAVGILNVYTGSYKRVDGTMVSGPSISDLVAAKDNAANKDLLAHLQATIAKMQVLVDTANNGEAYDQMIGEGNKEGNAKVKAAVDALVAQTRSIEKSVAAMQLDAISIEGSDSLDSPEQVIN